MQWPGTLCLYVSREERGAALGVERSQQQAICLMARIATGIGYMARWNSFRAAPVVYLC